MSADTEIGNLISIIDGAISSLSSSAQSLVATAIAQLNATITVTDPTITPVNQPEAQDPNLTIEANTPLGFPTLPSIPALVEPIFPTVDSVDVNVVVDPPSLSLPQFNYPDITPPLPFTEQPDFDTQLPTIPDSPDTTIPYTPQFINPLSITPVTLGTPSTGFITSIPLSLNTPSLSGAINTLIADLFGGSGGAEGLDTLVAEAQEWASGTVGTLNPLLVFANKQVITPHLLALEATETIRTQLLERVNNELEQALRLLEVRSHGDLPDLVLQAARNRIGQEFGTLHSAMTDKFSAFLQEQSRDLFEYCSDILIAFNLALQNFRVKEAELIIKAHQAALAYARQTIEVLKQEFAVRVIEPYKIIASVEQSLIQVESGDLQLAKAKAEQSKILLAVEQGKQETDDFAIQKLGMQLTQDEQAVEIYQAQVNALRTEYTIRKIPVTRFNLLIQVYEANINAQQALVSARAAEVMKDSAKADAEMLKVQKYADEVRGYAAQLEALDALAAAIAERNQGLLAKYPAQVENMMTAPEQTIRDNRFLFQKYQVASEKILGEIASGIKKIEDGENFQERFLDAKFNIKNDTMKLNFDMAKSKLDNLKAAAQIAMQGAGVYEQMAQGALSAANGVATAIVSES